MKNRQLFILIIFIALMSSMCSTPNKFEAPDFIYTNATIWTGQQNHPFAQAIATKDSIIVAIGTTDELLATKGINTQIIDLQNKFVTPGFIDNHVHFLSGGQNLASVQLRGAKTPKEFSEIMKAYCAHLQVGEWVVGGDWDHEAWGGELPHKDWIDDFTVDKPVFVSRLDGHMALANSKALQLAGITKDTPNPEGGSIVKDPTTGEPTGILKDEAMSLVFSIMPAPSDSQFDAMLDRAVEHALANGLTQVHDVGSFGGWRDLATYQRAAKNGHLKIRMYAFVPLSNWKRLAEYINRNGWGDDRLRWGGLKGFVDGSLGSTTAWFYEPYLDEPETSGLLVNDTAQLRQWIFSADAAALHLAVHAIGDRANDWLLEVFEKAQQKNGQRDRRFRIEHAQHLSRTAITRFKQLGVIPSMQPYHAIDDGRWAEKRIGPERILTTYAFRSLLEANANLTFGSDWTVAPLKPLEGIYAAVTRRTLDGAHPDGWVPQEKISVEEALRCYTSANAYAGFQENKVGILEKGKLADFVVLSENLFKIAPEKIKEVQVLRTIVGGKEEFVN